MTSGVAERPDRPRARAHPANERTGRGGDSSARRAAFRDCTGGRGASSLPWTPRTWPPSPRRGRDGLRRMDRGAGSTCAKRGRSASLLARSAPGQPRVGDFRPVISRTLGALERALVERERILQTDPRSNRTLHRRPDAAALGRSTKPSAPRAVGRVSESEDSPDGWFHEELAESMPISAEQPKRRPGAEVSRAPTRSRSDVRKRRRTGGRALSARQLT